mmetsp:Transcript_10505/g.14558  ORF Transcript_10505/g.14558 Transcript_10505/m.14558 type:complete len:304 (+) Transcript_10505:96-1007(+)
MLGPTRKQKLEQMVEDMKEKEDVTELRRYLKEKKFSIDDFTLKQTIGNGTFGKVDLASIEFQGEMAPVVIKTLPKSEICRLKQEEHVLSEKKCLNATSHEFIVRLLHAFQDQTKLYFIMEYVAGGDFFSYIRRKGRIKYEAARFYAAQITIALSYIHSKGYVYRGLKPENVLLTKEGHIKLADFGFSKKLQPNKRTYTLCGTPEYLAPEILHSLGHSVGVDWWAFGVFIFEMLAGWPPFYGETPFQVYQRIVDGVKKVDILRTLDTMIATTFQLKLHERIRKCNLVLCMLSEGSEISYFEALF